MPQPKKFKKDEWMLITQKTWFSLMEDKMEDIDALFKFKVGQIVQSVFTPDSQEEKEKIPWARSFQSYQIIERLLQECSGGVQKHYLCRGGAADGSLTKDYIRLNELELKEKNSIGENQGN